MVDYLDKLSWDDLRIVKAIGETESLARAAVATGVNPSTIFRRLARVERVLGVKLFERKRNGYHQTSMGEELVWLADRMERELVTLTNRFVGLQQEVGGQLKIDTSEVLASHLITPLVAQFLSLYRVRIQMSVGNTAANLAKKEADISIRVIQNPPRNVIGRKLGVMAWGVYRTRQGESFDGAVASGDSDDPRWVSYSGALADLKAARALQESVGASNICYRINSVQGVAAAIEAGLGSGYLPCMIGDRIPTLTRTGPIDDRLSDELWLLTHPELQSSRTVWTFFEYLAGEIDSQRALLSGVGTSSA